MTATVLPIRVPPAVLLLDVDGIPVSVGAMPGAPAWVSAWNTVPPREFDSMSTLDARGSIEDLLARICAEDAEGAVREIEQVN